MSRKDKVKEVIINDTAVTSTIETVQVSDKVLQPVGIANDTSTSQNIATGECIICKIDKDGNELPNTEFSTSIRMWDRVYSKRTDMKLKKKQ